MRCRALHACNEMHRNKRTRYAVDMAIGYQIRTDRYHKTNLLWDEENAVMVAQVFVLARRIKCMCIKCSNLRKNKRFSCRTWSCSVGVERGN